MKKITAFALTFLFVLSISALFSYAPLRADASDFDFELLCDGENACVFGVSRDEAVFKKVGSDSFTSVSTDNDIISGCFSDGKMYILTSTNQKNVGLVTVCSEKGAEREIVLRNVKLNSDCDIAVNTKYMFVVDQNNNIHQFTLQGESINVYEKKYFQVFCFGNKVIASGFGKLYRLENGKFNVVASDISRSNARLVSSRYLCTDDGKVYDVNDGREVLSEVSGRGGACETKEYLIALENGTLCAYNSDGEKSVKTLDGFAPVSVCAVSDNIYVMNSKGEVKSFSASVFFKEKDESDDPKEDIEIPIPETPSSLSFGSYKLSGKYIFVPLGTTRTQFKSNIKCDGFDVSFGKRNSGIGTATTVTFSKNGKSYTYIFVVWGDLTGEGNVNSRDLDKMFDCLLGFTEFNNVEKLAADLNCDGKISNSDLVLLARLKDNLN